MSFRDPIISRQSEEGDAGPALTPGKKQISLAVREFAVPVPRTGSIEAFSGSGRAAVEGREIHLRVQKKRVESDGTYEAEAPVCLDFEREDFLFRVEGRMDGIFRTDPPKIEEIKTGFAIGELAERLSADPLCHPYGLQLATYGYFIWKEQNILPALAFHLVSTRHRDALDIEFAFDLASYGQWLELRLDELVKEAKKAEKRTLRRRNVARNFVFPYELPRPGQREVIEAIEEGMKERRPMLIQAPTGLGKTIGVLYPVLREALGRGQRVIYITPKNSQHLAAEDGAARFAARGVKIKSLTITSKGKICFLDEPLCDPAVCEYAADYYTKTAAQGLLDILSRKRKLTARTFRDIGREYRVCPFELQLDASEEADLVICDYNYVFAPRSALGRLTTTTFDQSGKPNLVIDEAHNLPLRAMDYYSPALSSPVLEEMRGDIRGVPNRFRKEAEELLDGCIETIASLRPQGSGKPVRISLPAEPFRSQDGRLRAFLSRYLDSGHELAPRDAVMGLSFYWALFTEALEEIVEQERKEFFTTFHPDGKGTVKITCCDASAMINNRYKEYEQIVAFSATLKPFDYYARLSGLDTLTVKTAEFESPFPKERRKILVIPQVSTKYADRERNYRKIADAIGRISALRQGNYFVFFPSFEFLERVLTVLNPPDGFSVFSQEREMKTAEIEAVLDHLREGNTSTLLFAVQGGVFSEGVDYPGEMAIGAFVVGPPLPTYDLVREGMREYYQKQYNAGFDFAYAIPAMAKAVQAAGRVIRSESDRGLIVLMDSRFVQPAYARTMPSDWFANDVRSLVSDSILRDVAEFWGSPVI